MTSEPPEGGSHADRLVDVAHAVMVNAVALTACTHLRLAAHLTTTPVDVLGEARQVSA